jgi:hypothetical protein
MPQSSSSSNSSPLGSPVCGVCDGELADLTHRSSRTVSWPHYYTKYCQGAAIEAREDRHYPGQASPVIGKCISDASFCAIAGRLPSRARWDPLSYCNAGTRHGTVALAEYKSFGFSLFFRFIIQYNSFLIITLVKQLLS